MNLWAQKMATTTTAVTAVLNCLHLDFCLINKITIYKWMQSTNSTSSNIQIFSNVSSLLCVVYTDLKLYYQCEIEQNEWNKKWNERRKKKVIFVHYMNLLDFYGMSTTNLCDKHILYMHIFNLRILATAYAYYSLCTLLVCSVYVYAQI